MNKNDFLKSVIRVHKEFIRDDFKQRRTKEIQRIYQKANEIADKADAEVDKAVLKICLNN